jgi:hypothetical protein
MDDPITTAQNELETAQVAYTERRAALYDEDGQMRYSESEHERRLRQAGDRLVAAADRASALAGTVIDQQRALEEKGKLGGDPLHGLSAEQLSKAASLKMFIEEDVSTLRIDELALRGQSILSGGDKATIFVFARAADKRLQFEEARSGVNAAERPGHTALKSVLRAMDESLGGPSDGRKEAAKNLQKLARKARSQGDGSHDAARRALLTSNKYLGF